MSEQLTVEDCVRAINADTKRGMFIDEAIRATLRTVLAISECGRREAHILRQRVKELEQDRFTLRQMLHDLAYFSHIDDNTCNPDFEKGYNEAVSAMTASAIEYFTCQNLFADDFDKLDDLQIQLATANEKVRVLREATIELGAALSNLLDNANWGFFGNTYDAMNATRYKGRAALETTKDSST